MEEKDFEKKEKTENKKQDYKNYKVDSVISVVPLEPCVVWASISDKDDEQSPYKSIGIPGLYDGKNKRFVSLTGERILLEGFDAKLEEYIKGLSDHFVNQNQKPVLENETDE